MLEWNKDRQKEKKNLALLITLTFVLEGEKDEMKESKHRKHWQ